MKYLIPISFFVLFNPDKMIAQTEKINLSEVLNSIYFSEQGLNIKDPSQKMFFCLSTRKDTKNISLSELVNFDSFNSEKMEILYANEEKKIRRTLKKHDTIDVVMISRSETENNMFIFLLDIGGIDYKHYKKSKFKFTMRGDVFKAYYKSLNNEWVLDHIDRI